MTTWRETRARLREDRQRLLEVLKTQPIGRPIFLWLLPAYQAVLLHRLSHYLFAKGYKFTARFLWHLNLLLTGADINPISDIDGGFLIVSPNCITIIGKVGKRSTWHVQSGIGGGRSSKDIGAGPGLPVCGDDVVFEAGSMVAGPIRLGDRVRVGMRSLVLTDVPDDAFVEGPPSTIKVSNKEYLTRAKPVLSETSNS